MAQNMVIKQYWCRWQTVSGLGNRATYG